MFNFACEVNDNAQVCCMRRKIHEKTLTLPLGNANNFARRKDEKLLFQTTNKYTLHHIFRRLQPKDRQL